MELLVEFAKYGQIGVMIALIAVIAVLIKSLTESYKLNAVNSKENAALSSKNLEKMIIAMDANTMSNKDLRNAIEVMAKDQKDLFNTLIKKL